MTLPEMVNKDIILGMNSANNSFSFVNRGSENVSIVFFEKGAGSFLCFLTQLCGPMKVGHHQNAPKGHGVLTILKNLVEISVQ